MAIDIRTFGSKKPSSSAKKGEDDRPKALYWANIGYVSDVEEDDGSGRKRFVSLAMGIPVDTLETLPTNLRNRNYAFFNQARNELRDELVEECKKLAPGEDIILECGDSGLCIQLRRVNEETAAPTGENPFSRRASAG